MLCFVVAGVSVEHQSSEVHLCLKLTPVCSCIVYIRKENNASVARVVHCPSVRANAYEFFDGRKRDEETCSGMISDAFSPTHSKGRPKTSPTSQADHDQGNTLADREKSSIHMPSSLRSNGIFTSFFSIRCCTLHAFTITVSRWGAGRTQTEEATGNGTVMIVFFKSIQLLLTPNHPEDHPER